MKKEEITKELLQDLYWTQDKSLVEMSLVTGIYKEFLHKKMVEFRIPRRKDVSREGRQRIDLTGQKFGKLEVLSFHHVDNGSACWLCKCECGNEKAIIRADFLKKSATNCGCDTSEILHRIHFKGFGEISLSCFNFYKIGAVRRNLPFEITIEYIWDLFLKQNRLCALTGALLKFGSRRRKRPVEQTASLDRIDSNKGYIEGNLWWIHKDINWLKNNWPLQEFLDLCAKITDFQRLNKKMEIAA